MMTRQALFIVAHALMWFQAATIALKGSSNQRKITLRSRSLASSVDGQATMFVAVFTSRATSEAQRSTVRNMWKKIEGEQSFLCYRFVLCDAADSVASNLAAEKDQHHDMLMLNCQEGYAQGLLTRKVVAVMNAFVDNKGDPCLARSFLMKTDDDTFVAGNRLHGRVSQWALQYGENSYMGVPLPEQYPNRDPNHKWYEPMEVYPGEMYPAAHYGGPGYILGRAVVGEIIGAHIADTNILWNEDRAVGVWVKKLEQSRSVIVNRVAIPGTNGFDWDYPVYTGRWGDYPYVLAHHVERETIKCLTDVDLANNADLRIDQCFLPQA